MNDDKDKTSEPKGFSGINSLASPVDYEMIFDSISVEEEASSPHISSGLSFHASKFEWFMILAIVVVCIGLAIYLSDEIYSKGTTDNSRSSSPVSVTATTTAPEEQTTRTTTSQLVESRPAIGKTTVFSRQQIHYCIAEDIRLTSIQSHLDNYQESEVNWFNSLVEDYNARCGNYLYRPGDLEISKRNVEKFRYELQSEGINRLNGFIGVAK